MLQRDHVIFVVEHGFVVTRGFLFHLLAETLGLIFSVVQLGETVGDFTATHKELKPLCHEGVIVHAARQRRHLGGVFGNEGGIFQAVFHRLLEDLDLHLAQPVTILERNTQPGGDFTGAVRVRQLGGIHIRIKMQNGIEYRHPGKRFTKIVHISLIGHIRGAQYRLGQGTQHVLGQVHQVMVITVCLIELQHGEFRIMPGGEAFITEVTVDLEHLLEAAYHQPLQVQFRRNAQVHVQVQAVVMGDEGARGGAAGDHLQHRGFGFHKVFLHQEVTDTGHDLGANLERLARIFIDDQVHITLAVFGLGVGQALVLLGQRTQ